jgi:CRP/FNR family transcriptional regulator, cyclic AMP receptor protein
MARKADKKVEWLRTALPLDGLTDAELDAVAATSDRVNFEAGRRLGQQGHIGQEAFIIVDGRVDVLRDGETIASVGAGEVVGELAVLGGWERMADIVTATEVEAIVFDVRSFLQAMDVSGTLRRHVTRAVNAYTADGR